MVTIFDEKLMAKCTRATCIIHGIVLTKSEDVAFTSPLWLGFCLSFVAVSHVLPSVHFQISHFLHVQNITPVHGAYFANPALLQHISLCSNTSFPLHMWLRFTFPFLHDSNIVAASSLAMNSSIFPSRSSSTPAGRRCF